MSDLNIKSVRDNTAKKVREAVTGLFPIEGSHRVLSLDKITIDDSKFDENDFQSQYKSRVSGGTWGANVRGAFILTDKTTGKLIEKKTITLMKLPIITSRYSYIVKGHERQPGTTMRLSPGAYHSIAGNGDIVAKWNMHKGRGAGGFNIFIDRETGYLYMTLGRGTTNIKVPLYSVCKLLGVDDSVMSSAWGTKVFTHNKGKSKLRNNALSIHRAYERGSKADYKEPTFAEAQQYIVDLFGDSKISNDVSKSTLGIDTDTVTGQAIVKSGAKLLGISKGTVEEDDRQSLSVKTFHGIEDYVSEAIMKASRDITRKVRNNVDNEERGIAEILGGAYILKKPVEKVYESSQLPDQTNPTQMISTHTKTSIIGKDFGGISGENINLINDKHINPTHLGFVDPLQSPESATTGLDLHLPLGVKKRGNNIYIKVYDLKAKKLVEVSPADLEYAIVAYPDQFTNKNGKVTPVSKEVVVYDKDRSTAKRPASEVRYVLTSSKALFSVSANMIPFVQNNNGNRAMMASKHQEQAVSLKHREAPLVQTASKPGGVSFENFAGARFSSRSPVDGVVDSVGKNHIVIKDSAGKKHKVPVYDNYPLNGAKHVIDSEPLVKVGDKVKRGKVIADTNFTKDGTLAIGTNLRTAYVAYKGYNFEDGVVISESAADKLTSIHMNEEKFTQFPGMIIDSAKWRAFAGPAKASYEVMSKLGKDGVVREGATVNTGDVLVAGLAPSEMRRDHKEMDQLFKGRVSNYTPRGVVWKKEYPGKVVKVLRNGKDITIHIRTEMPMQIGDKMSGRHGNKGIITKILPNDEMPRDAKGKHVEVLQSPAGIPSRMNPGQVLETAIAKSALKRGKPFVVDNFSPGTDYMQDVKDTLKKDGISDTEELFDPETGRSIGKIFVGHQYTLKLDHQAEKKVTSRSTRLTGAGGYSTTGQPTTGSGVPGGGQKIGQLDSYAMLAHGANANLREMATFKSDENQSNVWAAVMTGRPLPAPKVSTSMNQFQDYLKGMGISMAKKGDEYTLSPITDKQAVAIAGGKSGEIKFASKALYAKEGKTILEKGGLFDPKITGGLEGDRWSYIPLAKRFPNPVFEKPIKSLLDMKDSDFEGMISKKVSNGQSGFDVIASRLDKIDVEKELAKAKREIKKAKGSELNKKYRKIRYLKALKANNLKASDAYLNKSLPVLPPKLRPIKVGFDGKQVVDDLNNLYLMIGQMNGQIKEMDKGTPVGIKQEQMADMYDAIRALKLNGMDQGVGTKARHYRGIMERMTGKAAGQPKHSFYQSKVIAKRQDLSARSVIIPEPDLNFDEVGVPKVIAMELYKPFVVKEMVSSMMAAHPLDALKKIKENDPNAVKALEKVFESRPVLMKRDPSLHKFSIQAFKPRLTDGKAIKIHPLVVGGFGADFDGDQMALFVPVSQEAVQEAKESMMPSKNLFSNTNYGVMHTLGQDGVIGIYKATKFGKKISKTYNTEEDAQRELKAGKVGATDIVKFKGRDTTVGRIVIHKGLPKQMKPDTKLLYDRNYLLDKRRQKALFTVIAKQYPESYGKSADHFMKLGHRLAYTEGASFSLNDFHDTRQVRDNVLKKYKAKEATIRRTTANAKSRDKKIVDLYKPAVGELQRAGEAFHKKRNNGMYEWVRSGAKGSWGQFGQMTMAPMLVQDPSKKEVAVPITKSFGEGLPISQYWAGLHGARKGTIDKASGTADPGAFSKDIQNTTMSYKITMSDCRTTKGVNMPIGDEDIDGRVTAADVKNLSGMPILRKGVVVTKSDIVTLRKAKILTVKVRSSLYCKARIGICQQCFGHAPNGNFYPMGTNIGVIAGHAMGEPTTQMQMRTFHTGGAAGASSSSLDSFASTKDVLNMPAKLKGSGIVASTTGTIDSIRKRMDGTGGTDVVVAGRSHYIPPERTLVRGIKVGTHVMAGKLLTDGRVNPHHLLAATGDIRQVRSQMSSDLQTLFAGDTRQRNIETVVRALTNVTRINDPGGEREFTRGQYSSLSEVEYRNKQLKAKGMGLISHTPTLKPISQVPITVQEDFLARLNYQRLQDTYQEGAAQGWSSDIHGHPMAGMAHGAEMGFKTTTIDENGNIVRKSTNRTGGRFTF